MPITWESALQMSKLTKQLIKLTLSLAAIHFFAHRRGLITTTQIKTQAEKITLPLSYFNSELKFTFSV